MESDLWNSFSVLPPPVLSYTLCCENPSKLNDYDLFLLRKRSVCVCEYAYFLEIWRDGMNSMFFNLSNMFIVCLAHVFTHIVIKYYCVTCQKFWLLFGNWAPNIYRIFVCAVPLNNRIIFKKKHDSIRAWYVT